MDGSGCFISYRSLSQIDFDENHGSAKGEEKEEEGRWPKVDKDLKVAY